MLTESQNRQLTVFRHAFAWNPPKWRKVAKKMGIKMPKSNNCYDDPDQLLFIELLKIKLKKMGVREHWQSVTMPF